MSTTPLNDKNKELVRNIFKIPKENDKQGNMSRKQKETSKKTK